MTDPEDVLRAVLHDPDLDAGLSGDHLLAGVLHRRDRLRRRRQRLVTAAAAVAAVAVLGGVTAVVAAGSGARTVEPAGRTDPVVPGPTASIGPTTVPFSVVTPVPAAPTTDWPVPTSAAPPTLEPSAAMPYPAGATPEPSTGARPSQPPAAQVTDATASRQQARDDAAERTPGVIPGR